ncbi:Uncharacterised protein [Mycobacterium tuberculosis]|nr:Uncharacterised protein [Mycobacterium tuberculosis]
MRKTINMRTAGIWQLECPPDFVIGFTNGIVPGLTDDAESPLGFHIHQLRMSSRYHERHERIFQIMHQLVGINMAGNVVYANERQVERTSERFCGHHANQQRTHQARALGNGNGRQLLRLHLSLCQRLFQNPRD